MIVASVYERSVEGRPSWLFKVLRLTTFIYVFLLPFESSLDYYLGFETPYNPSRVAGLLVGGLWVIGLTTRAVPLRLYPAEMVVLSFLLYGILLAYARMLFLDEPGENVVGESQLILFGMASYVVIRSLIRDWEDAKRLLQIYAFGVILSVAIFTLAYSDMIQLAGGRLAGFYKNPNNLAFAITLVLALLVSEFILGKRRVLNGIAALILSFVLLNTGSRGGLLGLVAAIVVTLVIFRRSTSPALWLLAGVMIVSTVALIFEYSFDSDNTSAVVRRYRYENIAGGSGRTDIWKSALRVGAEHAYMGIGVGRYYEYHLKEINRHEAYSTVQRYALGTHNDYISLLVEYGIIPFLGVVILGMMYGYRLCMFLSKNKRLELLWAVMVILATLMQGAARLSFISPDYWMALAISVSATVTVYNRTRNGV